MRGLQPTWPSFVVSEPFIDQGAYGLARSATRAVFVQRAVSRRRAAAPASAAEARGGTPYHGAMLEAKRADDFRPIYEFTVDGETVTTWKGRVWGKGGTFDLEGRRFRLRRRR